MDNRQVRRYLVYESEIYFFNSVKHQYTHCRTTYCNAVFRDQHGRWWLLGTYTTRYAERKKTGQVFQIILYLPNRILIDNKNTN